MNFVDPLGLSKCDDKSQNERKKKVKQLGEKFNKITEKVTKEIKDSSIRKIAIFAAKTGANAPNLYVKGGALAITLLTSVYDAISNFSLGSDIFEIAEEIDQTLDDIIECNEKADKNKKEDGTKIKGDTNEKNCSHLKGSNTSSQGEYSGGSYKGTTQPGIESHHMPAKASYPKWNGKTGTYNGGEVSEGNMPAIQMEKEDHKMTMSNGSSKMSDAYRNVQNKMIKAEMLDLAMGMDIAEIEAMYEDKYDKAIAQMMLYAKCMGFIL